VPFDDSAHRNFTEPPLEVIVQRVIEAAIYAARFPKRSQLVSKRGFRMKRRVIVLAVAVMVMFALSAAAFAQTAPDSVKKAETPKPAKVEKAENSGKPGMAKLGHNGMKEESLVDRINSASTLKTFAELLKTADLEKTLETGEFTVFAPTDDAFKKIPADALTALKQDKAKLAEVLKNHIVAGKKLGMGQFTKMKGEKIKTESGMELSVQNVNGRWTVADVPLSGVDMRTLNGPIHEVDGVIMAKAPATYGTEKTPAVAPAAAPTEKKEGTK
jgi:uncharacterized surface protein with fasciclin (FAS1) repeats